MAVSQAVAWRGLAGWLYIPPAGRLWVVWLTNEVPALPGLAVAWLERGTNAQQLRS